MPMSGWKSKPCSVTSWPPGPEGGEMKISGAGTASMRATAIFWLMGPNSPRRESDQARWTSSSVAAMEK